MTFLTDYTEPESIPQTQRADPRQILNNAGGYVFPVDGWQRLDRWLILGTQGGTFYATEKALTEENIKLVRECVKLDGPRVVQRVVQVSQGGLAAKQDYGLFTLAMCIGSRDPATLHAAYANLLMVARTGSTFFQLLSYLRGLRSSTERYPDDFVDKRRRGKQKALFTGNGLKRAVARWFDSKGVDQLAYQMVKYRQRYGLEMRDALRLAHPDPKNGADIYARAALYRWGVKKPDVESSDDIYTTLPRIVQDFTVASKVPLTDVSRDSCVKFAQRLPREALPTEWLNDPKVWEALLYGQQPDADDNEGAAVDWKGMPITALVRNLGNLSKCGLLVADSDAERYVCGELRNVTRIRAGRIHPITLYLASKQYVQGRSDKGSGVWAPSRAVVEALEDGFELAFQNVDPTNIPQVVAIDVSGSMGAPVNGYPSIPCNELAAVFAFVLGKTEPHARVIAFSDGLSGVQSYPISVHERLRDFVRRIKPGGGTDLSIPFLWARGQSATYQAVMMLTDNETWAGDVHVHQALAGLRAAKQTPVRAITIAATAAGAQVTDPNDPLALGIGGFAANVPALVRGFVLGKF